MGEKEKQRLAYFLIWIAIPLSMAILAARAADWMAIKGRWLAAMAANNSLRREKLMPLRGEILDRNGRKLATSKIVYCQPGQNGHCRFLDKNQALKLKAAGQLVEERFWRFYPFRAAAAHLTGYLSEIGKDEKLSCPGFSDKDYGNFRGRMGLEAANDCQLRGRVGWRLLEVDRQGKVLRELGRQDSQPGHNLRITADAWWQEKIAQIMAGRKGAVVMLEPKTGAIVALYSGPSFDPNKFSLERDDRAINSWLHDWRNTPLLNRAISGAYHPGSVFKIITASAGLEMGKVTAKTTVNDTGVLRVGKWEYSNWYWTEYGRREGEVNLFKAIQRSNDIYFYKLGEWVGIDGLIDWSKKFGVGQLTGIDLPGEVAGFLPSPAWKKKAKGESWFLGNTYHLAIGQGDLTMTPLQVALETAVVANGGYLCRPYLQADKPPSCRRLPIKSDYLNLIKRGMVAVCSAHGTAFPFFDFHPQVAGKTGTAEVGDGSGESHAWFTAFAPADNPQIVVTVFIERGGSGAYQAAPVARKILQAYFHGDNF